MNSGGKADLILKIELVPKTSWYSNLRSNISSSDWDKLRKQIYAQHQNVCGICGSQERLNCHEIWEYDDKNHIQKLQGFTALCDMCHHVKHIGYAGILAQEGKLDFDKVIDHFTKVNNCDKSTFKLHYEEAFVQWNERSIHKWKVDLGEYKSIVKEKE